MESLRCVCVVCGHSSGTPEDLVRETFRPTATLERTLEKLLCAAELDVKKLFNEITGDEGGLFCCPCVGAIHGGMSAVAELMGLEERLKIFGGMIRNARMNCGERLLMMSDLDDSKDSQPQQIKKPKEKAVPSKTWNKGGTMLPVRRQRTPGVQNCPSCDFFVDVRFPAEANKCPGSVSKAVREYLRGRSNTKLAKHFRSTHMPPEAATNFEVNNEGVKTFRCHECPYLNPRFSKMVGHYLSIHAFKRTSSIGGPTKLSCPEKGCSYFVEAPLTSKGTRALNNSAMYLKETITRHVLEEHDFQSSTFYTKNVKRCRGSMSLYVETKNKGKEFRCTRCDYSDRVPASTTTLTYKSCRNNFIHHFYNSHLKTTV